MKILMVLLSLVHLVISLYLLDNFGYDVKTFMLVFLNYLFKELYKERNDMNVLIVCCVMAS